MQRDCDECGHCYTAQRASSRFCGDTCGKRAQRARAAGMPFLAATSDGFEAPPSLLVEAVSRELDEVGRLGTVGGQLAVLLAHRVASRRETGSATAALAKQLHLTMTEALGGVAKAADPLDEIRARRDRKRGVGML